MADLYLTKSDYLDYRACPSFCWLRKHRPELVPPDESAADRRRRYFGNQIDRLARSLYPNGLAVSAKSVLSGAEETRRAIDDPSVECLFQATVTASPGFLARADVLIRHGDGWQIVEVKSACNLDDEHLADAAFQLVTFEAAGLNIAGVSLLHLDCTYVRDGSIDPSKLFVITDCTREVHKIQSETFVEMTSALDQLRSDVQPVTCDCHLKTRSNHCPTFFYFHPEIPEAGSIYELQNLRAPKLERVLQCGVYALRDWPDQVDLSIGQQHQLTAHRTGQPQLDIDGLRSFLNAFIYPLHFLDYETSNVPLPMFDGCWPYQQVPFQYSLHILAVDGSQEHREFLAIDANANPVPKLVAQLRRDVGEEGSLVAWNAPFEKAIHVQMAADFPGHSEFLLRLNGRVLDLRESVSRHHYVHPGFNGSSSIKAVAPVVAPDLSYGDLLIQDGEMAGEKWLACVLGEVESSRLDEMFRALREYCSLDTRALVRIWQHLSDLCGR